MCEGQHVACQSPVSSHAESVSLDGAHSRPDDYEEPSPHQLALTCSTSKSLGVCVATANLYHFDKLT